MDLLVPCIVEGRSELRNIGRVNCKTHWPISGCGTPYLLNEKVTLQFAPFGALQCAWLSVRCYIQILHLKYDALSHSNLFLTRLVCWDLPFVLCSFFPLLETATSTSTFQLWNIWASIQMQLVLSLWIKALSPLLRTFLYQCSSAQVRIRAKFKHISKRSAKIETNQDSLSNGEWSGNYYASVSFWNLARLSPTI